MSEDLRDVYDGGWFDWLDASSTRSATHVVPLLLALTRARTVIDIGCGVGSWLAVFAEHGCAVAGIDGPHVDVSRLRIPVERFHAHDLRLPLSVEARYDLVVSLETAEHLPPDAGAAFVGTLAQAGDVVAFSAAIPDQGGDGHLNERWPDEWADEFAVHGMRAYDLVRKTLWDDARIDWWFAQNLMLYATDAAAARLGWTGRESRPCRVVHPRLFTWRMATMHARHEDGGRGP